MQCFECGQPAQCEHHVVPKVLGGTRTVPLCLKCHGKVHERDFVRHKALQAVGIAKAKERGVYMGRKPGTRKAKPVEAKELKEKGLSGPQIAEQMKVSLRTVFRYLKD